MSDNYSTEEQLVIAGAGILVVSVFLPWGHVESVVGYTRYSATGTGSSLGIGTLALGVAAAGVTVARDWGRRDRLAVTGAGALVVGIAAWTLAYQSGTVQIPTASEGTQTATLYPGLGVYAALLGGLSVSVGGGLALAEPGEFAPRQRRAFGAAVASFLGVFLPWGHLNLSSFPRLGFSTVTAQGVGSLVGVIALLLAVVAGVITVTREWDRTAHLAVVGTGATTVLIAAWSYLNPGALVPVAGETTGFVSATPGAGIYVTLLGGLGMLTTGGRALRRT